MNDKKMDNQQATPIELSYLAGLWEGEGTITVCRGKEAKDGNFQYSPRVSLGNTSEIMISEIAKIFDKLSVAAYIFEEKRESPRRKIYKITVQKFAHVKTVLEAMLPYLRVKKAQAELLLRFTNSRISTMGKKRQDILRENGKIVGNKRYDQYTEEDISCVTQLRLLNKKGSPQRLRVEHHLG